MSTKMKTCIGPITDAVIDTCISELKKQDNKDKIMLHIIDPLLKDMATRYYYHFLIVIIVLLIVIILLVTILVINIMAIKK